MRALHALLITSALAACGGDDAHHLGDAPDQTTIVISPPDASVTIIDGHAVVQSYTAHAIDPSGTDTDITGEASFSLADASYGAFASADLTVSGQGAGKTRVIATWHDVQGDTGLTVFVKQTVIDPTAPSNAPDLFGNATEDPTIAPAIAYPLDQILVPPNLGQFDVHWHNNAANSDNLFEIVLANQYVDVRLYTQGLDPANPQPFWTVFQPSTWYPIASSKERLALTVAGLDVNNPATKGTAPAQAVDVTNENAQGGIYYWTTSGAAGIWRYDVSKPEVPPAPYFADAERPAGCMGCHTLSRDGTKIAMTFDGGNGRGTVFDVASKTALIPYDGSTQPPLYWDFATFDAAAQKLVTVEGSHLKLRAIDGTLLADSIPESGAAGTLSTHPEIAPDNSALVAVEFSGGYDAQAYTGSLVVRPFDDAANTFGTPSVLVAADPTNQIANWYPSYSPDGQWIAYTRTTSYSYNDYTAETWVVKADGSLPPIQLATADIAGTPGLTNSWARWVPFGQTFGPTNEPLFYLTFSSQRPFGVRIPSGGRPQIWMTPFFPARAMAGTDPSGPAFRVPFQDVTTSNHIAQWTQAVVVQ